MPMSRQYVLAIDQGTTSSRAIVFDRDGRNVGTGPEGAARSIFPKDGWVEHDPEDIWRDTLAVCRQAIAAAGIARDRDRRHRHHQPARDHRAVGARHRQRRASRHRLAGPAHRGASAAGWWPTASRSMSARAPAWSSTPTSPAPSSPGCSTTCRARGSRRERRAGLRHHRQLPALAPDRRPGPRDRRHQRLAHHAVRHHRPALGPRAAGRRCAFPTRVLPRGARLLRRVRRHRPRAVRCRRSRSWASPATSRRRPSARPASRRA